MGSSAERLSAERMEGNAMNTQVGKWGNSLAVRIPGIYAKELELKEGTELEMVRVGPRRDPGASAC
jgi:hypothetical protein